MKVKKQVMDSRANFTISHPFVVIWLGWSIASRMVFLLKTLTQFTGRVHQAHRPFIKTFEKHLRSLVCSFATKVIWFIILRRYHLLDHILISIRMSILFNVRREFYEPEIIVRTSYICFYTCWIRSMVTFREFMKKYWQKRNQRMGGLW